MPNVTARAAGETVVVNYTTTVTPPPPPPPPPGVVPGWQLTPSNTGLAGVGTTVAMLTPYTGSMSVSGRLYRKTINCGTTQLVLNSGAVLEECQILGNRAGGQGQIRLVGSGQQIINSDFIGSCAGTIESIGIYADSLSGVQISGLRQAGFTIFAWLDGSASGQPSTIDRWYAYGQPSGNGPHRDGLTRRSGEAPLTVTNSRITCDKRSTTGAFFIQPTWGGNVGGVTMRGCYLEGNGYCATIETSRNWTFDNNRFRSTEYGAVTASGAISNAVWTNNNVYSLTAVDNRGAAISKPF